MIYMYVSNFFVLLFRVIVLFFITLSGAWIGSVYGLLYSVFFIFRGLGSRSSEAAASTRAVSESMHQFKILNFSDENRVSLKVSCFFTVINSKKYFSKKLTSESRTRIKITILILKESNTSQFFTIH